MYLHSNCLTANRIVRSFTRMNLMLCLMIQGYSLESKDELVDALPTLKKRAAEDDPNILFSVASDLSKVNLPVPIVAKFVYFSFIILRQLLQS